MVSAKTFFGGRNILLQENQFHWLLLQKDDYSDERELLINLKMFRILSDKIFSLKLFLPICRFLCSSLP